MHTHMLIFKNSQAKAKQKAKEKAQDKAQFDEWCKKVSDFTGLCCYAKTNEASKMAVNGSKVVKFIEYPCGKFCESHGIL